MAPTLYAEVLARNIRAARSRIGLDQASVATRMHNLGYDAWVRQTVSSTERGRRRPTAEEIFGLAYVLETTIAALVIPRDEDQLIGFPSGDEVPAESVRLSAAGRVSDVVWWHEDKPVFPRGKDASEHFDAALDVVTRMRSGTWPPSGEEG